jgi:biopolymer transport protein ExbD
MANPEQGEEVDRWVVNLNMDGMAVVDGEPMAVNSPKFRSILRQQAGEKREKGTGFSERSLVIRADKRMIFQYVQQLILECQRLKLWKVKLQVILPEAELRPGERGG